MKKYLFDIQLFAEDGAEGGAEGAPAAEPAGGEPKGAEGKPAVEPKYTDEDVNKILDRKFAEWQKKQEKKLTEAERLANMTAEEKAAERMKALEDKLASYEKAETKNALSKQARAMLNDKNIHVDDALLANLIGEDAENTKASVESFISLFNSAVEKAVKEKVKGEAPKTGSTSGITKEQILAITNRSERQRLMAENSHLF